MQKREIFNPLTSVLPVKTEDQSTSVSSSTDSLGVSVSAEINTEVGVCPRCNNRMERATINGGDQVFYCVQDRISTPRPDSDYQ